jgi:MoxR-like ATPase
LALMLLARAVAAMAGRDYVVPEDVKQVAVAALAHRITLRPEMWLRRVDSASVVANVLQQVPAPASAALPQHSAGFAPSVHGDHDSGGDGSHGRHGGQADPLALPARRA